MSLENSLPPMDRWRKGVAALDVLQDPERIKRETGNRRILPLDITIEILCFLPAKTLVRFRRVCKLWQSITHDPHFIETHLHLQKIRSCAPRIIFMIPCHIYHIIVPDQTRSTPQKLRGERDVILYASCNGLLCLSDYRTAATFVVNPVTGDTLTLPPITQRSPMELVITTYFGFEPTTKEYKVVRIFTDIKDVQECQAFTLGTDSSWRQIHASLDFRTFWNFGVALKGVAVEGAIYWQTSLSPWQDRDDQALRFDLKYECFDRITLPCFQNFYRELNYLVGEDFTELQGSLCLPVFPNVIISRPRMDIWVMTSSSHDKQEWSIKYTIMFPWDRWSEPTPLFIRNNKIMVYDYSLIGNSLRYHDLHTNSNDNNNSYKKIYHHQVEDSCMVQFVHVESLVPLPS